MEWKQREREGCYGEGRRELVWGRRGWGAVWEGRGMGYGMEKGGREGVVWERAQKERERMIWGRGGGCYGIGRGEGEVVDRKGRGEG